MTLENFAEFAAGSPVSVDNGFIFNLKVGEVRENNVAVASNLGNPFDIFVVFIFRVGFSEIMKLIAVRHLVLF